MILIADGESRYGGSTAAGEHGGGTLAEVVAPCLLIGCDEGAHLDDDPQAMVRPLVIPSWWHLDVAPRPDAKELIAAKPRKTPVDDKQMTLPKVIPAPPMPKKRKPKAGRPAAAEPLLGAELFALRIRAARANKDEVAGAVGYLLERHGIAPGDAFAAAMSKHATRVGGFVAHLQEVLNIDGYQVIRYDYTSKQVHLDIDTLAQLFEVKL